MGLKNEVGMCKNGGAASVSTRCAMICLIYKAWSIRSKHMAICVELDCTTGVILALCTCKVLCGCFYAPYIQLYSSVQTLTLMLRRELESHPGTVHMQGFVRMFLCTIYTTLFIRSNLDIDVEERT